MRIKAGAMTGARRVPLRRSLVVRLLATSVLVAVCAIVATAWLAVQTTTRAIQQEQGRSLSDDTSVYDALLGYAATHADWSGVAPVVDERARTLGRRITLMTEDRQPIADSQPSAGSPSVTGSSAGPSLRTARPSATVDPLRVDLGLTGGTERIDPRAVGPYRLPAKEKQDLRTVADVQVACLRQVGMAGEVVEGPSGRPRIQAAGIDPEGAAARCMMKLTADGVSADDATPTERRALSKLEGLTRTCLGAGPRPAELRILPDFSAVSPGPQEAALSTARGKQIQSCVERSRQIQLRPYVAPPALLFVTDPADDTAQPIFNLSRANTIRITTVTGTVLILATLITVLVGTRLTRPLQALTEAARRPVEHQTHIPVTTHDEIGYLATALNDLTERREHTERQRKAMVSDIAHELRTPLTNIRSWLEAAQDGLTPVDPQLLNLLLDEALQLQHIIDDLRDLADADAGNLRIHPEPIHLNDTLEHVTDAHRNAADTAGVHLLTDTTTDPHVIADPVRLRQLLGNLVANAIRHTPAGGTVTVRSSIADGQLTIEVADTGTGIAEADLPKVFDRFWRADDSRTRTTGGSGLGLAIARKLTEAHGGTITATSHPGTGSTFTVRMPATP